jgi:VanZ family protein
MRISDLPRPLRLGLYSLASAVLLVMCLTPSRSLPKINLWDKAEHATAWFVLALSGLILAPRHPTGIAVFAFGMGVFVEVAQGLMGFGRDADWHDVAADCVGIVVAYLLYYGVVLLRGLIRPPLSRPQPD